MLSRTAETATRKFVTPSGHAQIFFGDRRLVCAGENGRSKLHPCANQRAPSILQSGCLVEADAIRSAGAACATEHVLPWVCGSFLMERLQCSGQARLHLRPTVIKTMAFCIYSTLTYNKNHRCLNGLCQCCSLLCLPSTPRVYPMGGLYKIRLSTVNTFRKNSFFSPSIWSERCSYSTPLHTRCHRPITRFRFRLPFILVGVRGNQLEPLELVTDLHPGSMVHLAGVDPRLSQFMSLEGATVSRTRS